MTELLDVPGPTRAHLDALRDRLAAAARDAELLDVAYRTLDTPVGRLLLAGTEHGLTRVAFENEDVDAVLAELKDPHPELPGPTRPGPTQPHPEGQSS